MEIEKPGNVEALLSLALTVSDLSSPLLFVNLDKGSSSESMKHFSVFVIDLVFENFLFFTLFMITLRFMSDVVDWSESLRSVGGFLAASDDLVLTSLLTSFALEISVFVSLDLFTSVSEPAVWLTPFFISDVATTGFTVSFLSDGLFTAFLGTGSALLRTPKAIKGFSEVEHFAISIGPFLGPSLLISCTWPFVSTIEAVLKKFKPGVFMARAHTERGRRIDSWWAWLRSMGTASGISHPHLNLTNRNVTVTFVLSFDIC
ncbi:unnamed protein product [Acanthoscelides obtectus]|uniref:Uncharacterized protein n=1 Tax=Acanthoscelides obtectus TaxID=200917 RepID=A0A9P0KCN2_ACAOB|nr:unnamed protein product [Acanthoscelides obtectus]CAK1645433.1 hypothetical protein AOBTE_LOCUS14112 [Acanthoscelides obtectus]